MFVTNLPARIVKSGSFEIAPSTSVSVGNDGLGTRLRVHGEGLIISEAEKKDKTAGYKMCGGEIIEFSGCVNIYNSAQASVFVSVISTDSI